MKFAGENDSIIFGFLTIFSIDILLTASFNRISDTFFDFAFVKKFPKEQTYEYAIASRINNNEIAAKKPKMIMKMLFI